MSTERDELADIIRQEPGYPARKLADVLIAAGYRKQPATEYRYGERFKKTGTIYHTNVTEEEARKFVEEMNSVGAEMEVVRRVHTLEVTGRWEPVA